MNSAQSTDEGEPIRNGDSSMPESGPTGAENRARLSGYKPEWLDTGPLTPETKPEPPRFEEGELTPEVVAELNKSLRELYGEARSNPPHSHLESDELSEEQTVPLGRRAAGEARQPVNSDAASPAADSGVKPAHFAPVHPPEETVIFNIASAGSEAPLPAPPLAAPVPEAAPQHSRVAVSPERRDARGSGELPQVARRPSARKPDGVRSRLLLISAILLAIAALIYFVNPFVRLALGMSSLARPSSPAGVPSPQSVGTEWCLKGDFLDTSGGSSITQMHDAGANGDILAQDGVYTLEYPISEPGIHYWQVVGCTDASLVYPPAPSWVSTTEPGQRVTFVFQGVESADRLFFPIPYVVSAIDGSADYRIVGDFQEWNPNDISGQMNETANGLFQQVRLIARSGSYEGYVIAGNTNLAVDAYGRTTRPIPFSFETNRNDEYVVFLLDVDRGRSSVIYDVPPLVARLAFGNGYRLISAALAGLALLLILGAFLRGQVLGNRGLQLESGCPRCGEHELMRIARHGSDRFLHRFGIPAYRYRCRHCTWEGMRLSEEGMIVSPGVTITRGDLFS